MVAGHQREDKYGINIFWTAVWKSQTCGLSRSLDESLGEEDHILKSRREAARLSRLSSGMPAAECSFCVGGEHCLVSPVTDNEYYFLIKVQK